MMRFVCFVLLAAGTAQADPEVATVEVMRHGVHGNGSGAVIAVLDKKDSFILTNRHVAPEKAGYVVRAGGKSYSAEWLRASQDVDLALLKVAGVKLESLPLAEDEPTWPDDVTVYGYGGIPKAGKVVGLDGSRFTGRGDAFRVTLTPEPGDSGSPLVDNKGRLVGLIWAYQPQGGVAVRLKEIKAFLDQK